MINKMKRHYLMDMEMKIMSNKYFLFCLSYEERCIAYLEKHYDKLSDFKFCCFSNKSFQDKPEFVANRTKLENLSLSTKEFDICIGDPLKTIDVFISFINSIDSTSEIIIDCTTFTHEHLLMLLKTIYELTELTMIKIVYTQAIEYDNFSTNEHHWLSKGIKDIRTIIGFNGNYYPDKKTHFVGMLGFEDERMVTAIEAIEPSIISIGIAIKQESVNEGVAQKNLNVAENLTNKLDDTFYSIDSEISKFDFSAINAYKTKESLIKLDLLDNEYNCVIFPMNNKISTIGLFLYALENDNLQVCYVEPYEYNTVSYSSHNYDKIEFTLNLPKK